MNGQRSFSYCLCAMVLCLLFSIQVKAEGTLFFVHNDHLGTPQAITDTDKNIVWKANYKPFGEVAEVVAAIDMPARFPGQYYDKETGYHYNYYRDYDPSLGRYIQSDPIGLNGGLNTYSYVGGNPLNRYDPLGLWSIDVDAYFGFGGGAHISYLNGTLVVMGRIGVGFGGSAIFDPLGTPTPHANTCGSGYIATTSLNSSATLGVKPFSAGGSYVGSSGNAVTTPQGGGFQSFTPTGITPGGRSKLGVGFGASVGVNLGSFTNW